MYWSNHKSFWVLVNSCHGLWLDSSNSHLIHAHTKISRSMHCDQFEHQGTENYTCICTGFLQGVSFSPGRLCLLQKAVPFLSYLCSFIWLWPLLVQTQSDIAEYLTLVLFETPSFLLDQVWTLLHASGVADLQLGMHTTIAFCCTCDQLKDWLIGYQTPLTWAEFFSVVAQA